MDVIFIANLIRSCVVGCISIVLMRTNDFFKFYFLKYVAEHKINRLSNRLDFRSDKKKIRLLFSVSSDEEQVLNQNLTCLFIAILLDVGANSALN